MTPLTCTATRRLLQPFHDGELAVGDQISVTAHVDWCDRCAADLEDLRGVATALQSLVPERLALTHDEAAVFNATVVNRLKVENDASFLAHLHESSTTCISCTRDSAPPPRPSCGRRQHAQHDAVCPPTAVRIPWPRWLA